MILAWLMVLHLFLQVGATPMWSVFSYAPVKQKAITRRPDVMLSGRSGMTTTSTAQYDGKPDKCRLQGWYYCFSDKQCYVSKDDAKDCFFKCVNIDDETMCFAYGCVWDYNTNGCGGSFRAGRFALNLCGISTEDSDGNWYMANRGSKDKRCHSRDVVPARKGKYPANIKEKERPLYTGQREDAMGITVDVPVYEDGEYTLRLFFADVVWGGEGKRVVDGKLTSGKQAINVFSGLVVNNGTLPKGPEKIPDAVDKYLDLTIKNNAKTLVWNGQSFDFLNYRFMVRIERNGLTSGSYGHAILNAVLLWKH